MIIKRQKAECGEKCQKCGKAMTTKYNVKNISVCGECLYNAAVRYAETNKRA